MYINVFKFWNIPKDGNISWVVGNTISDKKGYFR